MRIVTGDAGDPRVFRIPAAAGRQPIRLRSHRRYAFFVCERHVPERGVTSAAEIHGVRRRELRRVQDRPFAFAHLPLPDRRDVLPARTVARFAGDPRGQCRRVEDAFGDRRRRVAAEAAANLLSADAPGGRLVEIAWRVEPAAGREIEPADRVVIADPRLVDRAVALEQKGLTDLADTERPGKRRRRALLPVRYRIDASVRVGDDFVRVRTEFPGEPIVLAQNDGIVCAYRRPRHRRRRLRSRLRRMTWRARARADEVGSARGRFRRPPARTLDAIRSR